MIIYRVWKDAKKDNWQDAITVDEANSISFGYGYDEIKISNFNKTTHLAEINELHNQLFNTIIQEHNYISIGELSLWMQRPESEYYNEAISIFNWFSSTYLLIEQYVSTVTEANHQEPEEFIASLPTLNI